MMVKICGITNRDDAVAAVDAGATALGFNFYPNSPRYIRPEAVADIVDGLAVLKVGVFVNELVDAPVDVLQLHGDETPDQAPARRRVWKAFRVTPEWDSAVMESWAGAEAFRGGVPVGRSCAGYWAGI
jgi:phosphoribosylanthranilate isomerase